MAWIKSDQSLRDDPKVSDLMAAMNWDLDTAIAKLHRFWWWCVDHAEDGDLRKHNDNRIAAAVGVLPGEDAKNLVQAMLSACWLEREPYFRVCNWWSQQGAFLQSKYKHSAELWMVIRELYGGYSDEDSNGSNNGSNTTTDKIRKIRKKREENPLTPLVSVFPESLNTEAFREAWQNWEKHRAQSKHPMTSLAAEMSIRRCEKMGVLRAVSAIEHSIAGGYRGIFGDDDEKKQANGRRLLNADEWKNQAPYRG